MGWGRRRSVFVSLTYSCLLTSLIISHEKLWEWTCESKISDSKTNPSFTHIPCIVIQYFSYSLNPSSRFRNPFLSPFTRVRYLLKYVLSLIAGTEMMLGMQEWHSYIMPVLSLVNSWNKGLWLVSISHPGGDIMMACDTEPHDSPRRLIRRPQLASAQNLDF